MRAVVALIATLCLMTSGCSWTLSQPTHQSRIMDAGFVVSGLMFTPAVICEIDGKPNGDDGCFPQIAGGVLFGVPTLLAFAIAAAASGDEAVERPPTADGGLPAKPTDADTLQLAQQVQRQVLARQCMAARVTMNRIAERDAEYHIALLAKRVLGTCAAGGPGKAQNEAATVAAPATTAPTAAPLPDLDADETTIQLAKQVRTAAAAGQCASVERTMRAIAERDARYHAELAKADFVARCR